MITKKGKPTNKTNSTFPIFQPQKIVDCRMQGDTQEYQVKWSSIHFLSWETSTNLHNCPIYKKENTKLIQVIAFFTRTDFSLFFSTTDIHNFFKTFNDSAAKGSNRIERRRHSARDLKSGNIELLKTITTPDKVGTTRSAGHHRYNAFFKYALEKSNHNIEQAIIMVTNF